jgi:hypothetical protein
VKIRDQTVMTLKEIPRPRRKYLRVLSPNAPGLPEKWTKFVDGNGPNTNTSLAALHPEENEE